MYLDKALHDVRFMIFTGSVVSDLDLVEIVGKLLTSVYLGSEGSGLASILTLSAVVGAEELIDE